MNLQESAWPVFLIAWGFWHARCGNPFFWPADDDALRVKPPEQPSQIGFVWMRPKANQNLRYILGFLMILGTCQCELTFWVRKNWNCVNRSLCADAEVSEAFWSYIFIYIFQYSTNWMSSRIIMVIRGIFSISWEYDKLCLIPMSPASSGNSHN